MSRYRRLTPGQPTTAPIVWLDPRAPLLVVCAAPSYTAVRARHVTSARLQCSMIGWPNRGQRAELRITVVVDETMYVRSGRPFHSLSFSAGAIKYSRPNFLSASRAGHSQQCSRNNSAHA